jgi:hypothetical protein
VPGCAPAQLCGHARVLDGASGRKQRHVDNHPAAKASRFGWACFVEYSLWSANAKQHMILRNQSLAAAAAGAFGALEQQWHARRVSAALEQAAKFPGEPPCLQD